MRREIRISVIICTYRAAQSIRQCLESLQAQKSDCPFEVLVIDSSDDLTGKMVKEYFPDVRLYHFSKRMYCGEARNFGIERARGEIVAFLDADCTVSKNWIDRIMQSHQGEFDAIGGAIANYQPSTSEGWAAYFCEFNQWMPGIKKETMSDIAAANISYKKTFLQTIGHYITGTYCSDTHLHWRMQEQAKKLLFDPAICVKHHSIQDLNPLLRHEFIHGRSFARVRLSRRDFTAIKRLLLIFFWAMIAIKKIVQINIATRRFPAYRKYFRRSLYHIILACLSWAFGECVGYCHRKNKLPQQWTC
jgi:glycosyltransferase involved in cell wall biosynthesis